MDETLTFNKLVLVDGAAAVHVQGVEQLPCSLPETNLHHEQGRNRQIPRGGANEA